MLICKAAPAVGNAGCRASGCMELCAQTPSLKLGHTGRRLARGTLGLGGSGRRRGLEVLTVGPSEKRTRPAWRHWPPCPTPKSSQSIAWKPGHFLWFGKGDASGALFSPGWGEHNRSVYSAQNAEWWWVCVYTNLIPALKMLFLCTIGALEFSSTEMILLYLQYLLYFKGARFNFVIKLKC